MKIYLIRHTKVDVPTGTCYGSSDVKLATSYLEEKENLIQKITSSSDAQVYSSPLVRCSQLAQDVFGKMVTDERLKEYNFGDWELKKWDDIPEDKVDLWTKNFVSYSPPNGENMQILSDRVTSFWESLILTQKSNNQEVYVISHAGVIRVLLCYLLGMPLKNAFRIGLNFGSISQISVYEQYLTVDYINR